MSATEVTYYLPKSVIRLSATVKTTTDLLSRDTPPETSDWKAELLTVADNTRGRTVTLARSWLFDYGIKLAMSEDGRMTSASMDSTGQLGTVLATAAGLAVSIASAATFGLPGLLSGVVRGAGGGAAIRADGTEEPGDPVGDAYHKEHPEEFDRLAALKAEYIEAQAAVTAARRAHRKASAATRDQAWRYYRQLVKAADDVSSELDRAKLMFTTWRASKQKTTETARECRLAVADLPVIAAETDGAKPSFGATDGARKAQEFYEKTGCMVCATEPAPTGSGIPQGTKVGDARLNVLRPRAVTLVTVRKDADDNLQVTGFQRVLVVDEHCSEVSVPIRKSLFARRTTAVTLSELGALVGLELGGTSSASGAAAAATGVRTEVLAALESAEKARKSLDTLSAAGAEAELAGLKRELAIEEQKLLLAGQAATASDYARLQWLKQQVEIKEARAKLSGPIPL